MTKIRSTTGTQVLKVQKDQPIDELALEQAERRAQAAKNRDFVQLYRRQILGLVGLIKRGPAAAQILLFLVRYMSRANEVSTDAATLQIACEVSRATVTRAIRRLIDERWISAVTVSGIRVFKVNAEVVWCAANTSKGAPTVFSAPIKVAGVNVDQPDAPLRASKSRHIPIVSLANKVPKGKLPKFSVKFEEGVAEAE